MTIITIPFGKGRMFYENCPLEGSAMHLYLCLQVVICFILHSCVTYTRNPSCDYLNKISESPKMAKKWWCHVVKFAIGRSVCHCLSLWRWSICFNFWKQIFRQSISNHVFWLGKSYDVFAHCSYTLLSTRGRWYALAFSSQTFKNKTRHGHHTYWGKVCVCVRW